MNNSLLLLSIVLILLNGCTFTPIARYAVTDEPKTQDIIGIYKISGDMVVEDKRNNLPDAKTEIFADGTCNLVNFPIYSGAGDFDIDFKFKRLFTGKCQWKAKIVASVKRDGETLPAWGVCFDAVNFLPSVKCAQFANDGSPYNLVFSFGDPDQNAILVFDKHPEK